MVGQRSRVHIDTEVTGVGIQSDLIATIDESSAVNVHGLRASFAIEPESADANANGTWALQCLPRAVTGVPNISVNQLELETDNAVQWAVGVWAASNQTPYTKDIDIRTSRNCEQNMRIVLSIRSQGISSGNVRSIKIIRYFVKSL